MPSHFATRAAAVAISLSGLVGCSGATNTAPIIDKLDMPDTSAVSTDKAVCGNAPTCFVVKGSLGYHDDDGTVRLLRVYVPASQPGPIINKDIPAEAKGEHELILSFSGVPSGTKIDYEVAVVDSEGLESAHTKKSVTLL
jgi:hypothetical protein